VPTETRNSSNFTPVETEFTASTGRVFKLRELSAWEQMLADGLGSDSLSSAMYSRTAASVVSIDGDDVHGALAGELSMENFLKKLSGRELDELMIHYAKEFSAKPADLKNESTPVD
jgi:hypothetical protein